MGGRGNGTAGRGGRGRTGRGGRGRGNQRGKGGGGRDFSTSGKRGKGANGNIVSQQQRGGKPDRSSQSTPNTPYPPHLPESECRKRYNEKDPNFIRGTLRVLPARDAAAFCTCDRGSQSRDVLLVGPLERNRALDGDQVYVELLPPEDDEEDCNNESLEDYHAPPFPKEPTVPNENDDTGDQIEETWWQDDAVQVQLWDPLVPITRKQQIPTDSGASGEAGANQQRKGRVVCILPPKDFGSEIHPNKASQKNNKARKKIVGTLKRLQSGTTLLTCANKSLPQFRLSNTDAQKFRTAPEEAMFSAQYVYGSWQTDHKWPPCQSVSQFGTSCNVEDETTALLIENDVDHGEFPSFVLEECQRVVASGEYSRGEESGWKPTPEMYKGRRDYRNQRIFTIDPTTAKDLDDALHIKELDNGQIELGVHIADVSHFVTPGSSIDLEAQRRCTTVYLVDRTIPMLPRPLCEIACSLNEDVERLAFSCVWRMNKDGTLVKGHPVWYGRSVIRSCARLDYSTAQNIIDRKVADPEKEGANDYLDEELWPVHRRPTGGHTIAEVASDVRLMHQVGMARRRLRFRNGAVALNAVKLTFQLDADRETPLLCQPYPIRDSNRLVEEYMLLANYLVAQRLITHASGLGVLRNHEPPLYEGLEKVVDLAKETLGISIDVSSSEALQRSLNNLGRRCAENNTPLILQTITEMMKLPMRAATYIVAGSCASKEEWAHFALNIPYYTHFTSPIRRYADVLVHRLLQATLDGSEAIREFGMPKHELGDLCDRCNDKKEGSRKAQERSDTVFLALYLKNQPMRRQMGIVLSVGQKTFTVFVPSLGISALVFVDEHASWIDAQPQGGVADTRRRIRLVRTGQPQSAPGCDYWNELMVQNFTRVRVTCKCQDKPPITVKLALEGPWIED